MSNDPVELPCQLEQLKAENRWLREFHGLLRTQRKELMDQMFGPADKHVVTDEEIAAALRDPNRVSFRKMMAELGITSIQVTESVLTRGTDWTSRSVDGRGALPDAGEFQSEVEWLEADNHRLREANDYLRAQRKEYSDALYADLDAANALTEEDMAAAINDPNRVSIGQFLAALGIIQDRRS